MYLRIKNTMENAGKYNILIVDDNQKNIELLGAIILEIGFEISVALNGEEALKIIKSRIPDLILLDINMPGMDGFELCQILKQKPDYKNIPIIFLTAFMNLEYKKKAFSIGGLDYITKPFQKEEVLARIKIHIEISQYRKELEELVKVRTAHLEKSKQELELANQKLQSEILKNKELEKVLIQNQKMETVGTLAGGLAHDFNNILGGITGSVSLLEYKLIKNKLFDKKEIIKYLETIKQGSFRAANIIDQLLSISKKQESSLDLVDINLVIKSVVELASNSIDKSVELIPQYYKKPVMVNGDFVQLEQVLLNFCINGAHAMTIMRNENDKIGGKLYLYIEKINNDKFFQRTNPQLTANDYWKISIRDTGVGIPGNKIDKIFNPFYTTKKSGSGLGLAMVYNIIKNHNGLIDVFSEVNNGTVFSIYLPVFQDNKIKQKKEIDSFHGDGTLLIIDADEIMRRIADEILTQCSYTLLTASNEQDGLILLQNNKNAIKVVIFDLNLSHMDVKEFYNKLKELKKDLKVLLVSGFKYDERIKDIINSGTSDFIQKPYTLYSLSKKIYNLIHQ